MIQSCLTGLTLVGIILGMRSGRPAWLLLWFWRSIQHTGCLSVALGLGLAFTEYWSFASLCPFPTPPTYNKDVNTGSVYNDNARKQYLITVVVLLTLSREQMILSGFGKSLEYY